MEATTFAIKRFAIDMAYYLLWLVEIVLLLRFVAQLLAANPQNQLIALLYSASAALMGPFTNMFAAVSFDSAVVDFSALVAMAAYAVIAYLLVSLIEIISKSYTV